MILLGIFTKKFDHDFSTICWWKYITTQHHSCFWHCHAIMRCFSYSTTTLAVSELCTWPGCRRRMKLGPWRSWSRWSCRRRWSSGTGSRWETSASSLPSPSSCPTWWACSARRYGDRTGSTWATRPTTRTRTTSSRRSRNTNRCVTLTSRATGAQQLKV